MIALSWMLEGLKPTKADLSLNVGEQSSNEGDYMEAFMEVFKYALKFSDMSFENIWLAHETLTKETTASDGSVKTRMRRLQGTIGSFRGVKVPEKLTDETIEDNAPFMAILYRYLGSAYSVTEIQDFPHGQVSMRIWLLRWRICSPAVKPYLLFMRLCLPMP